MATPGMALLNPLPAFEETGKAVGNRRETCYYELGP